MQQNGIRSDQITQVRGFADQRLHKPETPLDPSNRRISLIGQYMEKKSAGGEASEEKPEAEAGGEKHAAAADERNE